MSQYIDPIATPMNEDNVRNGITLDPELHQAMDLYYYVICIRVSP